MNRESPAAHTGRLTPQRWGPRRVLPYCSRQNRRAPGGGEEAGEALDAPAPPPTPRAAGTAPRRLNTRLYLVLHLPGRPLPLRPSPYRRPPGRGRRVCRARRGRGVAVGAAPAHEAGGSPAAAQLPPVPSPQGSPTCCQVRPREHLETVAGKTFLNDRCDRGGGGGGGRRLSLPESLLPLVTSQVLGRLKMPGSAHLLLPNSATLGQSQVSSPEMDEWVAEFIRGLVLEA